MLIKASQYIELFENNDEFMLKIIVQKHIVTIVSVLLSLRLLLQNYKIYVVLLMFYVQI